MHARIQLTGPLETRTMYTQLEDIEAHTLLSRSQVCKVWVEPVYAQPAYSALSTLCLSLIGHEPSQASALIRCNEQVSCSAIPPLSFHHPHSPH